MNQPLSQPTPAGSDEAARRSELQAAAEGDFGQLMEPYRRELQAHCYRILGSLHEAEDQVQETLLRAWRRRDTYEGRASLRAWLYKIATNACLDALDRRRARRWLPQERGQPADPSAPLVVNPADVPWLEPFPDDWLPDAGATPEMRYSQRESVSLAFLAALQSLPPRQRVVVILSDVLDWPAREVADLLEVTPGAVSSALHRGRATLLSTYHGREPATVMAKPVDEATRRMLERYVQVWEAADVAGLVALMREDVVLAMPPAPAWYAGRPAVGQFLAGSVFAEAGPFSGPVQGRWRLRPCAANGAAGFGLYLRAPSGDYLPFGLTVVSLVGPAPHVATMTVFIDAALPARFGLPASLPGDGAA